jgi:hypothetical protein
MRTSNGRDATSRGTGTILALLLVMFGLAACDNEVEAPPLAGPSTLGLSIDMAAAPDFLNADGISRSTVTITVRGPNGQPVAGQPLFVQHDGDGVLLPAGGDSGRLQTGISLVSDGSGVAQVVYQAGKARDRLVKVRCEPYSSDAGSRGEPPRYVVIHQR